MAFSHVASICNGLGINGGATSALDTTGADLIVVYLSWYDPSATADPTISDSKGNTWTPLTKRNTGDQSGRMYYCRGGTVGAGHTFQAAASGIYSSMYVVAVSGSHATPFDAETGATTGSGTSLATGSLTPSEGNCLVTTGLGPYTAAGISIGGGFAGLSVDNANGVHIAGAGAYLIQTSAAAANPTWSWSGTVKAVATIAAFKSAGGGGGGGNRRRRVLMCGSR